MKTIEIKVTDQEARILEYALRKKYGKNKNTQLAKLCKFAIWQELIKQLEEDVKVAEQEL